MKKETGAKAVPKRLIRTKKAVSLLANLAPSLVWYVLFFCIPVGLMFAYSFWKQVYVKIIPTFTLENYIAFFTIRVYSLLLAKSLLMTVGVTLGSIALAYPAAYYLALKIEKHKYMLMLILWGPFWTSYLLIVLAWKLILGYTGALNSLLMYLGLISEPLTVFIYSPYATIIALIHIWAPWLAFPIFVSLEKMDRSLLEAAADLGATPRQAFLKVTLPLSMPGVLVAVLFVFIPVVGEFVTPSLIGGPSGIMFGNAIEDLFHHGHNWPMGSAFSFIMLVVVMVSAIVLIRRIGLQALMESL
jgi:spermidine/putrescine transport system permease protein